MPSSVDPSLFTVFARVKNPADAVYVRDQILGDRCGSAAASPVPATRLAGRQVERPVFLRAHASTAPSASPPCVARYASYKRSLQTVNKFYRTLESLTPADLDGDCAASTSPTRGLIVTTLSKDALPAGIEQAPALERLWRRRAGRRRCGGAAQAAPP